MVPVDWVNVKALSIRLLMKIYVTHRYWKLKNILQKKERISGEKTGINNTMTITKNNYN